MFRALEHEGVAATCLFELFAGERRMTSDERVRAVTACAVLAQTLKSIRTPPIHPVVIKGVAK